MSAHPRLRRRQQAALLAAIPWLCLCRLSQSAGCRFRLHLLVCRGVHIHRLQLRLKLDRQSRRSAARTDRSQGMERSTWIGHRLGTHRRISDRSAVCTAGRTEPRLCGRVGRWLRHSAMIIRAAVHAVCQRGALVLAWLGCWRSLVAAAVSGRGDGGGSSSWLCRRRCWPVLRGEQGDRGELGVRQPRCCEGPSRWCRPAWRCGWLPPAARPLCHVGCGGGGLRDADGRWLDRHFLRALSWHHAANDLGFGSSVLDCTGESSDGAENPSKLHYVGGWARLGSRHATTRAQGWPWRHYPGYTVARSRRLDY